MALAVNTFVMGPFRSNCYVLRSERGAPEAAIVDPGDDPTALRLELASMGTRPGGILVTHTDVDHIGGVAALADGTGAEVWAPAGELEALRTGRPRGGFPVGAHDPAHTVGGGDEISVAGIDFEVLDVPGHSPGHVAYWRESDRALILGDVLFGLNPLTGLRQLREPPDFFTPDPAQNRESARKLAALEPALVCFGHGPPERDTKRFTDFIAGLAHD
jgi:hydroxyacylglutathione hydrolase